MPGVTKCILCRAFPSLSSPALTRGSMLPGSLLTEAFLEMVQPAPWGAATSNWRSTCNFKAFLLGRWQFYSSKRFVWLLNFHMHRLERCVGELCLHSTAREFFWPTRVNQTACVSAQILGFVFFFFNLDILVLVTEFTSFTRLAKLSVSLNTSLLL